MHVITARAVNCFAFCIAIASFSNRSVHEYVVIIQKKILLLILYAACSISSLRVKFDSVLDCCWYCCCFVVAFAASAVVVVCCYCLLLLLLFLMLLYDSAAVVVVGVPFYVVAIVACYRYCWYGCFSAIVYTYCYSHACHTE